MRVAVTNSVTTLMHAQVGVGGAKAHFEAHAAAAAKGRGLFLFIVECKGAR